MADQNQVLRDPTDRRKKPRRNSASYGADRRKLRDRRKKSGSFLEWHSRRRIA